MDEASVKELADAFATARGKFLSCRAKYLRTRESGAHPGELLRQRADFLRLGRASLFAEVRYYEARDELDCQ